MARNRFRKDDEDEKKLKQREEEEKQGAEESAPSSSDSAPSAPEPSKAAQYAQYAGVRSGARGKVVTEEAWNKTQYAAETKRALDATEFRVSERNWDSNDELGERRYKARLSRHAVGLHTEEEKLDTKPNKMQVNFDSVKDNKQAVFVAATLHGKAKQQFLEDYAKHTGQSAEALYREAESYDGLFTEAMSNQKRMSELGLMNLNGEDIDLDKASPDAIVQGIRDIADSEKQKEAVKLFQSMTRDKNSRFYGYNAYNQDYTFRDSAMLTQSGFKKYAKELEGRFDPREDALEKSLRIYVSEYDKLAAQGNYVLRQELPLLEKAFAQQMGLDSAPDVEKIREKLRVEDSIRATRELGGKGKKDNGNDRSTWQKIGDWWNEFTEGAKQKWDDVWADEEEPETAGPTYQRPGPQPTPTIDEQIAGRAVSAPKAEAQTEAQGPAYQKPSASPKTIDQLIAENSVRRPLPEEALEAFGPDYQKPGAVNALTPTIDEQIASRAANAPKSKKEEPAVQPGSVDLTGSPIEAMVGYVLKGKGGELTDETEAEVEAFVRSSPEMMALLGILSDEELKLVEDTEDMHYMAVARKTGVLGPLTPYALKAHGKGFLRELSDEAASMLLGLVQEVTQMPLSREEIQDIDDGLTNRSTIFFEKHPEKLEALDAAISLSDERRLEALGQKDVSSQEALEGARRRCRSGYATEADWKMVYDHAPVTTAAQKYGDKTYQESVGQIMQALDESYMTDSTDDWFNFQTLEYMHDNGLYQDLSSVEAIRYKNELEAYLREALAGEYDAAYALGYESLGDYWTRTGSGSMANLQQKALALQEADQRAMATATQEAASLYQGDGSTGTVDAVVEGGKLGLAQKKQQAYEALATLGVAAGTEAERFEVTTHYYSTGSFTDAEARCKDDLYQMIEEGYFPNEDVAGYVKDYLDNGGSALELGIMPSAFGWKVARNAEEAKQRAEDLQAWAQEKLNTKQGRYFEVSASTSLNTGNQLDAIVLSLPLMAVPGSSAFGRFLFGTMNSAISYGKPLYTEGVGEALKGGADLAGGHVMGTSMAFAQAVAEMYTDFGIADDALRAMGVKDMIGAGLEQVGGTAARRFWHAVGKASWRTAGVVAEEVTKDEFFGGTFTEAAKAGTWKAIELTNGMTELPTPSEMMKIAGAVMTGGVEAIGPTTRELIHNLGENTIMTLPIALMTGMAAGATDWRSTRKLRAALETGRQEDIRQAGEAIVEDMSVPKKAQAMDAAALEARISKIANDLMVYDAGEIGRKMAAARLAKEQADSHQKTYTNSRNANKVALSTMNEAQAKINDGDTSAETLQALKDAQESFAKTRNNMDESWREYQEKKAESDSLHAEAHTMARNEASKQVQQERAGLAQKVQEAQAAREQEQTEADLRAMEVEAFIAENHPDADDAQKDQIRKDLEGADFSQTEPEAQDAESEDITPEKRQELYNAYRFTSAISKIFGVKIRMANDSDAILEGSEGAYDHDTGEIVINKNATPDQILRRVVMHELTHRAEHSGRYQQLADALIQIKFGGDMDAYQSELDSVTRLYSADHELAPGEAERELVARIAGEILGGNQDFINRFVQEKPSIAQRFADTIKSVIDRLRGVKGSKELAKLRKVEKMFRKALEDAKVEYESGADLTQSGVSKSLPLDKKEWAQFYSKIGEIKIGKAPQFMDAANGEKILEINNKLVYTDGNWDNPRVSAVIEIDLEDEYDLATMREVWYQHEDGNFSETDAFRIGEEVHGKEVFRRHDSGASGEGERGAGGGARGKSGRAAEGDSRGRRVSKSLPSTSSTQKEFDAWRKSRGNSLATRNQLEETNQQTGGHGDGERQFATQTAQRSEAMPEWLKAELYANPEQRYYLKDTNNDQLMRAWGEILHNGYEQTRDRLLQLDHMTADDVAASNVVMAMAFRNGDMNTAMLMAHKYNTDGTLTAKALQARKLFSRMTPSGLKAKVAGEYERKTAEYMDSHEPAMKKVRSRAKKVEDKIKGLQGGDELLRLNATGSYTVDASNKWGMPINEQQAELIRQYKLDNVPRPGENFYNRATTKQRMLEAILATPNPLELTGNGLNLIERLEMLSDGLAVVTNADLNYIGRQLALYAYADADTQQGREGDLALSRAYEAYGNIEPATFSEKMRTWGYVSMLLSVPSAIRNVIGNAGQNTLNAAADGLAIWLDKKISEKTGQRTRANLTWKERAEGWHAFVQETKYTWRDYFTDKAISQKGEERFSLNQRGRVYQTPALEAARLVEGYLMSVGDRNFWKMKYVNAMAEQMRLAELNGVEFDYDAAVEIAEAEANYATFNEDSKVKDVLSQAKQIPGIGWLVHFAMPFTGVPTSIAKRSLEYSPLGVAATAIRLGVNAAQGKSFDQRAFVNGMSRGLTGTAMWGIGMALMKFGLIHLGTSEDEDDLYNLNTAQGEQYSPYIQVGDEYVSLAAFAPSVSSMIMGAKFYEMLKDDESKLNAVYNACFASLDQIIDASYLSGLQDFFEALNSDGAAGAMTSIASNAVSQNIPAVLGQIATCLDPYVRDTKDANDIMAIAKSTASKIPILREEVLSAKVDITGTKVKSKEGLRNFFDPFTTTDVRNDATLDELERLWRETGGDVSIPSFLVPNSGKITILKDVSDAVGMDRAAGENKLVLSSEQRVKYNEMYGQRVFAAIGAAMNTPDYLYGDDSDKAQIIETLKKNELQEIKLDIQRQICRELGYN